MNMSVARFDAQQSSSDPPALDVEPRGTLILPKEVQFGDLILTFTTEYEERWKDVGSGANDNVAFYHPIAPPGFYVLGSIGLANYDAPGGRFASMCVKVAPSAAGKQKVPLAMPVRWDYIWHDEGSDAKADGSCWRPVPPDGYVALGDVFVQGYQPPSDNRVVCVARELVIEGKLGARIWSTDGSPADRSFWASQIDASRAYLDTPDGIFSVNSFVGGGSDIAATNSPVWNLRLPLPTFEAAGPTKPTLTSRTRPPPHTVPLVDRIVTVPFTAVTDGDKTLEWKVTNSPFYSIERSVDYELVMFIDNDTSLEQSTGTEITSGVSKEESQTFSITTGITVGYEGGVEAGGFSSKVTVSLSLELGYTSTTSVTQFRSESDQATLIAAPKHAAALWTEANSLRVFRGDATPVGPSLSFQTTDTAYVVSEYDFSSPRPDTPKRSGPFFSRRRSRLR